MLKRSDCRLSAAEIGDAAIVSVPEFDRGRSDPPNIIGVILGVKDKKYQIGTKEGIIEQWLERNCFEVTKFKGIRAADVPSETHSIRSIVRFLSVGSGQGYQRCNCKKKLFY